MCQLHFISSPNDFLNRAFLLSVTALSAREKNDDGVGVYSQSWGLFKTEISANGITNFGKILSLHPEQATMLMAHTRSASPGIVVNIENAHPFEGERFILAHNGRLWKKEETVSYQASTEGVSSDSKEFLDSLEKYAKENKDMNFTQLITDVMKEHKGKFAFIIFDKKDSLYYAIRGKTAGLYKITFLSSSAKNAKSIGYAITTGKSELYDAAILACNLSQLSGEKISVGEVEEIQTESVFLLTNTAPVLLGSILESAANFTQPHQTFIGTSGVWRNTIPDSKKNTGITTDVAILKDYVFLGTFMKSHRLSIIDMDRIFFAVFGNRSA